MSMILFACVVRVRDGLPLSASTDFYHTQDFLDCRRRLKTLALRLAQYPGRGSAKGRDFSIHFSSSRDVACMAICSHQCPSAMAFYFLETLWWEFTASYDTTCIGLASRPYAFLEFAPNFRMEPVTALGVLSLILNIMCAALNLIRGIHLAEHSLQVAHEEIGNILAFLIPFVACIFQCYLYLFYSPARTMKVVLMLLFICLGNMYLHGLRNLWQILFHIGVAFLSSHQILTRQLQEKQSDCGV
ncbi:vesicle-trafficking protein SEC22c isoform X2 [Phacochoerus africanus]|uniref:vesicle-trafficking protein SEC22c isoform X2 n=1 Tax=Phacochoerus africanus TaxID=41426 RepID=UPI001FD968ED|nr:vesicle-trafficking protein SEC22c isoform X2 [Phacochoerus africanus]